MTQIFSIILSITFKCYTANYGDRLLTSTPDIFASKESPKETI